VKLFGFLDDLSVTMRIFRQNFWHCVQKNFRIFCNKISSNHNPSPFKRWCNSCYFTDAIGGIWTFARKMTSFRFLENSFLRFRFRLELGLGLRLGLGLEMGYGCG